MNFRRPVLSARCEDATIVNFLPVVLSAHCKDATIVNFLIAVSFGMFSDVIIFGKNPCSETCFQLILVHFRAGGTPRAFPGMPK